LQLSERYHEASGFFALTIAYAPILAARSYVEVDMNSRSFVTSDPQSHDIGSDGVNALIELTNQQFKLWESCLREETIEEIPSGSLMHYWFILSNLALRRDQEFSISKKDSFYLIPNLSPEAARKHVAAAGQLGFLETVKYKRVIYVRLTKAGERAVSKTLRNWVIEFGRLQDRYFCSRDSNTRSSLRNGSPCL
jgi:hypothetical protein